ncbi:MAG: DUF2934 domain-containing protein [Stellaceae bacterium]
MDDKRRIREWAYELWEKEGRPHGRALDHWLAAERRERSAAPAEPANEGEGNRTAAREFNRAARAFAYSGLVEQKAHEAEAALTGAERKSLKKAEQTGRSRSRGEDPEVKR